MPAIVVRNHRNRHVAQLCFPRQTRFRKVSHSDHVHSPTAIEVRLRPGRKLRPFHVEVDTAVCNIDPGATARLLDVFCRLGANWLSECNVHHKSIAEKCIDAMTRAIDKLIRDYESEGPKLFFEGPDGG